MILDQMDLGTHNPSNHRTGFQSADEIVEWFHQEN